MACLFKESVISGSMINLFEVQCSKFPTCSRKVLFEVQYNLFEVQRSKFLTCSSKVLFEV